jgi:CopG family nickel-responsive transcriptional regulator
MNLNDNYARKTSTRTHTRSVETGHSELVRFSVAMPEDLLMEFDKLVGKRGIAKNRSEVIRDLVREALIEERTGIPGTQVIGTLTIVYNHHSNDLQDKLHAIQHDAFENIVSTTHVHVDQHTCLEVIIIRGETYEVQDIANTILGTKGVKNGKLALTTAES